MSHGVHGGGAMAVCELGGRCGLHVVVMVVVKCMWTTYGFCVMVAEAVGEVWADHFQSQYQVDGCI